MADPGVIGVTGATGFVGRALARTLVEQGARVRRFSRLAKPDDGDDVQVLDIEAPDLAGVDTLVHLAGRRGDSADEQGVRHANVRLTERLARSAVRDGVRRLIFASSLHVHGNAAADPVGPGSAFAPHNAYGRSKVEAEAVLRDVLGATAVLPVVVRPPMIYGPQAGGSFIALARLVRLGVPLPLGNATAPRSICSVDNAVSALISLIHATNPPSILLPADAEDSCALDMALAARQVLGVSTPMLPFPPAILSAILNAGGRGDMAASLFQPLRIDRSHWTGQAWRPTQDDGAAMRRTLRALAQQ